MNGYRLYGVKNQLVPTFVDPYGLVLFGVTVVRTEGLSYANALRHKMQVVIAFTCEMAGDAKRDFFCLKSVRNANHPTICVNH